MLHIFRPVLAAAAIAGCLAAPEAHADVVAASEHRPSVLAVRTQLGSDFLSQAMHQERSDAVADDRPGPLAVPFAVGPQFVQSGPASRNPLSTSLRGSTDLFLWNLVAMGNAQKSGNAFDLIDTGVTSILAAQVAVAAVPLPGALWLFVMGLLGLGGTQLGKFRDRWTLRAPRSAHAGPRLVPMPA